MLSCLGLCLSALSLITAQTQTPVLERAQDGRSEPAKFVVFPGSVSSHFVQAKVIITELSRRGHRVQVILTDEGASRWGSGLTALSNVSVIAYNTSNVDEMWLRQQVRENQRAVGFDSIRKSFGFPAHSIPLLQNTDVHNKILEFGPDLALCDIVLAGGAALADKLGIPKAMLFIPGQLAPLGGHLYGSGASLTSTVPQWMTLLPRHMTFLQRVQNYFGHLMNIYVWDNVIAPQMDKTIWQRFDIPPYSYKKSNRQAPLVLFPSDWAITPAEPMSPHLVSVGPITAAPAKALPSDLEAFVQSAGDAGVVFASLGVTAIPEAAELKAIAQGLSAIAPTKVIWKLAESDVIQLNSSQLSVGSNVRIVKWAPQNDLLGHPNVKVFFTQCGSNSFNEASYHGTPIVGMPLFAEQPDNVARAEERGFGLSVSVKKLNTLAKDLEGAIKRILIEPSFSDNAAKISSLMRAHRLSAAEVAADALEHAAWTKGSRHLQPLRDDLNWFQHSSYDVFLFLACIGLTVISLVGALLVFVGRKGVRWLRQILASQHAKSA